MLSLVSRQHWKRNSYLFLMCSFHHYQAPLRWGRWGKWHFQHQAPACMEGSCLLHTSSGIFRTMQVNHSDGFLSGTKLWPLSIDGFPGILEGRVLAAQPWNLLHHPLFTGCPFSSGVFISVLGLVSAPYICYFYFFLVFLLPLFLIGVEFLCNVVLISVVQRSELVLCIHVPPPSWTSLPSNPHPTPLGHLSTELSPLYYTTASH